VCVCLFVCCVSRAWPSAWAWHRACSAAPQAPCPTAYHCRADSKQFARNCRNSLCHHLFGRPLAESCRAKRRRPRAVIGRKMHFRRLSHSHFRNGPRRRLDELGRRRSACAPQSSPRVQTKVAPSPLPDLTVVSNTGVWVPPVETSARRGATPPSGGRVWSCVDHTLARRPTSDRMDRAYRRIAGLGDVGYSHT
jgi:hypothetical protein